MAATFKFSLQNLSPLPTSLKVKSADLEISWSELLCKIYKFYDRGLTIMLTKFKTKLLNLSLNQGLSPFMKLAPEFAGK